MGLVNRSYRAETTLWTRLLYTLAILLMSTILNRRDRCADLGNFSRFLSNIYNCNPTAFNNITFRNSFCIVMENKHDCNPTAWNNVTFRNSFSIKMELLAVEFVFNVTIWLVIVYRSVAHYSTLLNTVTISYNNIILHHMPDGRKVHRLTAAGASGRRQYCNTCT